jgi:hypothetical protein
MNPPESLNVIGFAQRSSSFSAVYCATLPEPEMRHSDVAGGHVRRGPDVALHLGHERLAEPHHLAVGSALRVEVCAALAGAEGQRRERVLEDLLEREELQHPEIDRRVEPQAALVRADR